MDSPDKESRRSEGGQGPAAPSISLPKGGGAIRGIGEKFAANPVTGTGSASVPLATSPGRSGFGPQLTLSYDSGSGNGPFGFGWSLSIPLISRKTDKGLPRYRDAEESDVYLLSGAEDLVPVYRMDDGNVIRGPDGNPLFEEREQAGYRVRRYRPRVEGLFARIERWTRQSDGDVHWRSFSRDNILTVYGRDAESRVFDPEDSSRVFTWLICETRDDKGNAVLYGYKPEDGAGDNLDLTRAHERNRGDRNDVRRTANRYLKRIRYGNRVPLLDGAGQRPRELTAAQVQNAGWMFEVVFDYGEHDEDKPTPGDTGTWTWRDDPFSTWRAGFEVRTGRLCQRVLMFHHFPSEPDVGADCLVRSTDFTYSHERDPAGARNPVYTFLLAVTQYGYRRKDGGYLKRGLPPVEYEYTQPFVQDTVEEVDAASLENLPIGVDGAAYQWTDLHGEGIPGILTEQAGAWFYQRNVSPISKKPVEFAPLELVAAKPNLALAGGGAQFMDLAGDGQPDLVVLDGPMPGLYEHDGGEGWQPFRPFTSRLQRDTRDPNLKLVDLDGDGHADVLISENDAFVWHPSLAEDGFGPALRVPQALDEEKGPRLVFADGEQSIHLADLSGDGLTDLVRIRNGEVCYWPNQGYGRFGAKITMDQSPWFDHPDQFDPKRLRLADIDGSGTTDILYLHRDGVRLYFNQSGNGWSVPRILSVFPRVDDLAAIVPTDLLGNGTACLVWSSSLPGDARRPMRYVDLMGGKKPHLLVGTRNNLGAETRVEYASSTRFYLRDKWDGRPWITRLAFPVHVVERVETRDHISGNRFVTRYAYHHGYFDGEEREFRGFGMVEQWDTEVFEDYVVGVQRFEGNQEVARELYQPPVQTRRWYHTGAFLDRVRILHQFREEYYQKERHLPEPALPPGLDAQSLRESLRALKGLLLRQEIYSFDGSAQEQHPYRVVENNFEIRLLQPREKQQHAVLFPVGRESISLDYERNPQDPRIGHRLSLEVDEYGNLRKSCSLVYGRKVVNPSLPEEVTRDQQRLQITYVETDYTRDIDLVEPAQVYRLRTGYEARSYEITGISQSTDLFQFEEIKNKIAGTARIDYEILADGLTPQKRLLSHSRILFLDNYLNPLPLGDWDSLGLGYQSYQLAFTSGVMSTQYEGKVTDAELIAAGYLHFNGDADWWAPSGTTLYPPDPAHHFYLPLGLKDPLGVETVARLDPYDLLVERVQVRQTAWNETIAINDYRVLGPVLMTDPNKNRSAVEIDALGMVVKSAVMGKSGSGDGDTLDDPTMRMEYELFNWRDHRKPNFVRTLAREGHGTANPRWQESYAYSNGSGGVAMVKAQANPGKALGLNSEGAATEIDADPRWVGNGRTILNNKGKPVKQYEPYFSTTHEYEDEKALRELGVTPILYYDALGRNIRTLFPNGTQAWVEFDPWMQEVFDANDTVKESRWYADRGSPDPETQPEPLNDPEHRAAWLAAKHADTPGEIHFDCLGRPVYAISDYGNGKKSAIRSESDLTGRLYRTFDPAQREVASGFVGMAGTPIVGESAEKGRRWTFQNVLGSLVKTWDEHGRKFRAEYDQLNRPVSMFVQENGRSEILFNYVLYGDHHPNAESLNLLGVPHQIFDQAGMVRMPELDFKGNPKRVDRILARDFKNDLNWKTLREQPDYDAIQSEANLVLDLEEVFTASSQYDALNRPTQVTLPDGTVMVPIYNEANFLASLRAQIRGEGAFIEFLKDQDYDAKGQRQFAHYGNEVFSRYFYDAKSFRLTHLLTNRSGDDPDTRALQSLRYTYDAVGNITQIRDEAQQEHYFGNAVVRPENLYEYDAVYQLIRATGREHAGLDNDAIRRHSDLDFVPQLPHLNDVSAVRTFIEEYEYDLLGNIKVFRHRFHSQNGSGNGWTRRYHYAYEEDPTDRTNRLISTSLPGDPEAGPYSATYDHDAFGNITRMPHLPELSWSFLDRLRNVDLGGGGRAYYGYGLGGQRLRKVIERNGTTQLEWIFLGAVMIFRRRRRDTNAVRLERWTVHISDNTGHIAQVDTKTRDDDNSDPANPLGRPLIRYQYANHLGSASMETDENGDNVISYEEYHPYGTTSYRSVKSKLGLSLKRYRFSGKERDDETGLYYFGARFYAAWLGRWTSSDPAGFVSGFNLYRYCHNSPLVFCDPNGMQDRRDQVTVDPESPEAALADPSQEAEARAYLQGIYTARLRDQSQRFVIDQMQFVEGGRYWLVERWHLAPRESAEGGSSSNGEGGGAAEEPSPSDASSGEGERAASPAPAPTPETDTLGAAGATASQTAPAAEKFIWNHNFSVDGVRGSQRGFILQNLYTNNPRFMQRDSVPNFDYEPSGESRVQQIKSTESTDAKYLRQLTRDSTRAASEAITNNPTGTMAGKRPQAVIITPTDAPASVGNEIDNALGRARRPIPNNPLPPERVRGLPGIAGTIGRALAGVGYIFSAFALGGDIARGDVPMGIGDALGTVGGGLELYAMAIAGATMAMTAGLVLGGLGIAVGSGVSGYRSYQTGDTAGAIAGGIGVGAGLAIAAGAIGIAAGVAGAPLLLAAGIVFAIGVGVFHAGRYFSWW